MSGAPGESAWERRRAAAAAATTSGAWEPVRIDTGPPQWLIVTGISGSGRTTCLRALEDLGWFCVDNLPARLLPALQEELSSRGDTRPVAVGLDIRAGALVLDLDASAAAIRERGHAVGLLFLDCSDDVLVRRFAETRRKHPVLSERTIAQAIARERQLMLEIRERTTLNIDTSDLTVHQLKARITELFEEKDAAETRMVIALTSFGFKHGVPRDADYVFDVRALANPHFVDALRPLTGMDEPVARYVFETAGGDALLQRIEALLDYSLPMHRDEGRAIVSVAIGCTGGRHRSVALIEALSIHLRALRVGRVVVTHRDAARGSRA
ncbi:MAG: RNase adapter RapZ [Deltaproteobacteria bacterium]|nr:RNase adapter RapZ [Deltaproteobacteria bacterium]